MSITLVSDRLVKSRISALVRRRHCPRAPANLADFVSESAARLPSYLEKLGASLEEERRLILNELGSVTRDIDHIKHIVQSQQSYAKADIDFRELVQLEEVMEDASGSRTARSATTRSIWSMTTADSEGQHRSTQAGHILVNLIDNAKQAAAGMGEPGASGCA